jgi:hypothetical protein
MSGARDLHSMQQDDPLIVAERAKESRLVEIRREAESKGRVIGPGVRLPGAPFPVASPETGYYGIPLLKQPQWTWEIPLYFFVGGAAASAAVIGAMANLTGRDEKIARDARFVAAAGTALSSGLLIADLGRPSRFLAMLRVFKPQSPISMGAWVLAAFGTFSGGAAIAQALDEKYDIGIIRVLGNVAEAGSLVFALPFSNYTGVLIGATVIPVWNHNIKTLPVHFGMSGLNSGVSVLELLGHERSRALNVLGMGAAAMETYEGYHVELKRDPHVNAPLKHGVSGWITRVGGVLSGPVPLALRVAASFMGSGKSRQLRKVAAWSSIAGSILTRYGWVQAGHVSAKDWKIPLQKKGVKLTKQDAQLQSIGEFPRMKASG